jgi:uncharacterized protein
MQSVQDESMLTLALGLIGFVTATLSGVFGMAGGMILMGAFAALLPVADAMVLHGATQLLSNAHRAVILLKDVYLRGLAYYAFGALVAYAVMAQIRFVPEPVLVFATLGCAPFLAAALPARLFDFERPAAAMLCGAQVISVQMLAGAAGPLLDIAFVNTGLSRTQVVATKAVTQVLSHGLKLIYFIPLAAHDALSLELALGLAAATLAGTWLGTQILRRMSDQSFRRWSRLIVFAVGGFYLAKAGTLLT